MSSGKHFKPNIIIVLIIAFIFRLILPFLAYTITHSMAGFYSYDTLSYLQPAKELLATGQFTNMGIPEIYRTPGYPFLLIPGIFLGKIEFVTLLLQLFLGVLNVYLVYEIGGLIFRRASIALAGSLLMAIEPLNILYGSKLLSETLFCTALLLFTLFISRYLITTKFLDLFIGILFLIATVYIRPISYYLPIVIFCFLLIKAIIERKLFHPKYLQLIFFLIASYCLIGLWQFRNYIETGFQGFSSVVNIDIYFNYGASVVAVQEHIPYIDMENKMGYRDESIYLQLHPEQKNWTSAERLDYMKTEGMKLITNHILIFTETYFIGLGRTLFDPGANEYLRLFGRYNLPSGIFGVGLDKGIRNLFSEIIAIFKQYPLILYSNMILFIVLLCYYFLFVIGFIKNRLQKNYLLYLSILIGIYLFVLSGGAQGIDRYRVPIMPYICLFAGYGLITLFETKSKVKQPQD